MKRSRVAKRGSAVSARKSTWLPGAFERLESRFAMDGGGVITGVALPPYSPIQRSGYDSHVAITIDRSQGSAPLVVTSPALAEVSAGVPTSPASTLQAGAPSPDQQTQGAPSGTVKTRDAAKNAWDYPGPLTSNPRVLKEILDPWPGSLAPNGPGADSPFFLEHEYFHFGEITIDFSDICMPNKLAKVNALADAIFADIRKQLPNYFNPRNQADVAEADGPTFIDGDTYYSFKSKGILAGGIAPAMGVNGEARDGRVYVIMNDLGNRRLQATTLGNHMLVGHRFWQIDACEDSIRISTWTDRERRNGWANEVGFWFFGPNDTVKVWKNFLVTVADTHKRIGTIDGQVSDVFTTSYYGPRPGGGGASLAPIDQDLFAWVYGDDASFTVA